MKKALCVGLLVIMLVSLTVSVSAAEIVTNEEVVYYDDGSYLVISIQESFARAAGTKTGSVTYTYHAADGSDEWKAVLKGTFTYDGTTSTCTSSSCTVTVYADNWYEISKTAGKSGGIATASVTMGRKFLGITIAQDTYELTLACDKDGNLS